MFQVFDLRLMLYQQNLNLRNVLLGIVKSNIESFERGRESFLVPSGTSGAASSRDALLLDPHARDQQLSASSFSGLGFNNANETRCVYFLNFCEILGERCGIYLELRVYLRVCSTCDCRSL